MSDEVSQTESLRQVLEVENMIEDGCEVLLDKEQTLIRQGEWVVRSSYSLYSHRSVTARTVLLDGFKGLYTPS